MQLEQSCLRLENGHEVPYRRLPGNQPGVMFFHGHRQSKDDPKSLALMEACRERGQAFVAIDFPCHGDISDGGNWDMTISDCVESAKAALDHLTDGPQIIVGHSMGGWVAAALAMSHPKRVAGYVGLAPAIDMTSEVIWLHMNMAQKLALRVIGKLRAPPEHDSFLLTMRLIEDGEKHSILNQPERKMPFPIRVLHAREDDIVPYTLGKKFCDKLLAGRGGDTRLITAPPGQDAHELNDPEQIKMVLSLVNSLIDKAEAKAGVKSGSAWKKTTRRQLNNRLS